MSDKNICILSGHLGRDAELRYGQSGTPVLSASLAVNSVSGKGEQRKEYTTWVPFVMFGVAAEKLAQFLTKGRHIMLEGRYNVRSYVDKNGAKRWQTNVVAREITFLNRQEAQSGEQLAGVAPDDVPDEYVPDQDGGEEVPF